MHHPFTDPLASVLARCRSSTQVSWDDCGRSSGRTLLHPAGRRRWAPGRAPHAARRLSGQRRGAVRLSLIAEAGSVGVKPGVGGQTSLGEAGAIEQRPDPRGFVDAQANEVAQRFARVPDQHGLRLAAAQFAAHCPEGPHARLLAQAS